MKAPPYLDNSLRFVIFIDPLDKKKKKFIMCGMAEFLLEHWQLIASVVLALFNLVLTLAVHALSTNRIKGISPSAIQDSLTALIQANSAILEKLNEKESK